MKIFEYFKVVKRGFLLLFKLDSSYALCLIFGCIVNALIPYIPTYFSAKVIDSLYGNEPIKIVVLYVLLTIGLVFILKLLATFISTKKNVANNNLYRNERWMYSEKAMEMAYESIESSETALLCEKIKKEFQTGFGFYYLINSLQNFISSATGIVASLSLSLSFFALKQIPLYMKLILMGLIVINLFYKYVAVKKGQKFLTNVNELGANLNMRGSKLYNYMGNYSAGKDIRLYDVSDFIVNDVESVDNAFNKLAVDARKKMIKWTIPFLIFDDLLKLSAYIVLIYASLMGSISVGSIAKYVSCLVMLMGALTNLINAISLSIENHPYLVRYFSYFDIPNNMYQGSLTVEKRMDNEYYVEFHNVSYKYPNTDTYALKNVNVKFKIGEKLAVVGMNGSGKTTFIKLLCRLYDPTEGEILLNGVNIKKYDYEEYMQIFSVVFQDFKLFAFTLGQNVACAPTYDTKKVEECLKNAGFEDRYKSLPDGAETYLYKHFDKSGIEISGGEAQKIPLARALYKDSPFIILDEPTSALDPVSEYEIYSSFNTITGDKTAIYISHRLASCRFCDNIVVFDNGSIIQHGSHENLLSDQNGKYHELWNAQAQYYL